MAAKTLRPGPRLRAFRERLQLSLRRADEQLNVTHPALKDWEEEHQVPVAPYRDAIEVWTGGEIKATEWPLKKTEQLLVENAAKVRPAVSPASDSGEHPAFAKTGTDRS